VWKVDIYLGEAKKPWDATFTAVDAAMKKKRFIDDTYYAA
jgi:hypothetical protein